MVNSETPKHLVVSKDVHKEVSKLATWNEIQIKSLANEMLNCMLEKHKEEITEIIAKLKMKKGN